MKRLLLALLFPAIVSAEPLEKGCIAVFEPKPCRKLEHFIPYRGGVLLPSRFGFFDTLIDRQGRPIPFRYGLIRGSESWFFYKGRRTPKRVTAIREGAACQFVKGEPWGQL
jgi:hypothetical protein